MFYKSIALIYANKALQVYSTISLPIWEKQEFKTKIFFKITVGITKVE
jgi:hypothetical protein